MVPMSELRWLNFRKLKTGVNATNFCSQHDIEWIYCGIEIIDITALAIVLLWWFNQN
jgi:hypothetical protein